MCPANLHDASLSCILKKIVYILLKPYFNLKKENDYGPSRVAC